MAWCTCSDVLRHYILLIQCKNPCLSNRFIVSTATARSVNFASDAISVILYCGGCGFFMGGSASCSWLRCGKLLWLYGGLVIVGKGCLLKRDLM